MKNRFRKVKTIAWFLCALSLWWVPAVMLAQTGDPAAPAVDTGDTAWVLMSTALVMLMVPGLALFYGGLVRRKNVLSILMQCFMMLCVISIQWMFFGYSLAFGPDMGGITGSLAWFGLKGVGAAPNPDYAATIPHQAFMVFQLMFAIITPALIIGAFTERIKFSAFCVFSLLWATLVYDPMAHWVWGVGGFLRKMGTLDFAGGIVVHINAGMAALAAAFVLGRRQGYPDNLSPPHNLPLAALGAGLLWFGWFGFNGGSALGANGLAVSALTATHVSAAAAGLTWAVIEWWLLKKPTMLGMISGVVAGMAAVTPAAGFVNVFGAFFIGIGAGAFCYLSVSVIKVKFGYDDSLDAFGIHGVGCIWGVLAAGLWATKTVNPAGADGLFFGNPGQFWVQAAAVGISAVYSFVVSWILFKLVDAWMGLRVTEHEERVGLDLTQHREAGYTLID